MFATFGTVDFAGVSAVAGEASEGTLTALGLLLLLAPAASPPRCRCSPGCSTRWRARPRCRR